MKYRSSNKYRINFTYRGKTGYTQVNSNSTSWNQSTTPSSSWSQVSDTTPTWSKV
jgi:hypothetical protein